MPSSPAADNVSFAEVRPLQSLDLLSQREMTSLATSGQALHTLFRRCALAVLNTGDDTDDASELIARYQNFDIRVVPEYRGLKLEIENAPGQAFVDGRMITGIRAHLFSALRDIVYMHHKLAQEKRFDLETREGITDAVFRMLRNADALQSDDDPRLIVCWGGHSISRQEYDFTKEVGYQLGLRDFDIATGCGPGAMKGPMKGATIGHAKQFNTKRRYIGLSEPGIITAESPNPIVNELVIMPDIEKRLEAFVRLAHGIIVFPGGVGTAEEVLYLLCVKMHPNNADIPLPIVMAAPRSSADYFAHLDEFLAATLGEQVRDYYDIIIGDPAEVARRLKGAVRNVRKQRVREQESFSFNWRLFIDESLQHPFEVTHESMAELALDGAQPPHELAANLRRSFSGLVAGNVKDFGIRAIAEHGPYKLRGDPQLMARMSTLLEQFVADGRMKIDPSKYVPCFEIELQ